MASAVRAQGKASDERAQHRSNTSLRALRRAISRRGKHTCGSQDEVKPVSSPSVPPPSAPDTTHSSNDDLIGTVIDGRFDILERLSAGGMVWCTALATSFSMRKSRSRSC